MSNFINNLGKIVCWPKKPKDKYFMVKYLAEKFVCDKIYSEKEVNMIIEKFHLFNDVPLLRRELVSRKFINRENDGSKYWKNK